jgi:membrane protease YdiL (CAAX protease family)
MFIEQGISKKNVFGKYLIGSVFVFFASALGQVPLIVAIAYEATTNDRKFPTANDAMMRFLEPNLTLFLLLISFVFAFYALILTIKYIHKQTLLSVTTARKKIDWSRVFYSFSVWSIITIISTLIYYYAAPDNFIVNFKPIPFLILVIIGSLLIPIQTSTEEYLFRGYLMQGFGNLSHNKWFPLLMTSFIFGGMHFFNPEVTKMGSILLVYYIGTGLFLGILTLMDEGLELALGFHASNNLIGALLVTSDWTVFQTHSVLKDISEPQAGVDVILPVVVVYPILLYIFSKKYQWTQWRDKLTGKLILDKTNNTKYKYKWKK